MPEDCLLYQMNVNKEIVTDITVYDGGKIVLIISNNIPVLLNQCRVWLKVAHILSNTKSLHVRPLTKSGRKPK